MLTIHEEDDKTGQAAVALDMDELFRDQIKYPQAYLKPDQMTYKVENERFGMMVVFERLSGSGPRDSVQIWSASADLLMRLK